MGNRSSQRRARRLNAFIEMIQRYTSVVAQNQRLKLARSITKSSERHLLDEEMRYVHFRGKPEADWRKALDEDISSVPLSASEFISALFQRPAETLLANSERVCG
jgi:hypothetical protein